MSSAHLTRVSPGPEADTKNPFFGSGVLLFFFFPPKSVTLLLCDIYSFFISWSDSLPFLLMRCLLTELIERMFFRYSSVFTITVNYVKIIYLCGTSIHRSPPCAHGDMFWGPSWVPGTADLERSPQHTVVNVV